MIPDFPHNIEYDWPNWFFLLRPDVSLSLPCWLSQYRRSLVSSNLNSKLFRFHCVRPNLHNAICSKFKWSSIFVCGCDVWSNYFEASVFVSFQIRQIFLKFDWVGLRWLMIKKWGIVIHILKQIYINTRNW